MARRAARPHVKKLLVEAKLFRSDLIEAHVKQWHPLKPFEDNARSAAMDCCEAFRCDLYPNLKIR